MGFSLLYNAIIYETMTNASPLSPHLFHLLLSGCPLSFPLYVCSLARTCNFHVSTFFGRCTSLSPLFLSVHVNYLFCYALVLYMNQIRLIGKKNKPSYSTCLPQLAKV